MTKPVIVGQNLIDPSGNWKQSFTDANGNSFIMSALYNQTGRKLFVSTRI
jgi:hypothetical protein